METSTLFTETSTLFMKSYTQIMMETYTLCMMRNVDMETRHSYAVHRSIHSSHMDYTLYKHCHVYADLYTVIRRSLYIMAHPRRPNTLVIKTLIHRAQDNEAAVIIMKPQ